jgi:hypothetical protein
MTFLWPAMLWLGVLIPVIVAAYVLMQRRRKKQALRYARLALVRNTQGAAPRLRRHFAARSDAARAGADDRCHRAPRPR